MGNDQSRNSSQNFAMASPKTRPISFFDRSLFCFSLGRKNAFSRFSEKKILPVKRVLGAGKRPHIVSPIGRAFARGPHTSARGTTPVEIAEEISQCSGPCKGRVEVPGKRNSNKPKRSSTPPKSVWIPAKRNPKENQKKTSSAKEGGGCGKKKFQTNSFFASLLLRQKLLGVLLGFFLDFFLPEPQTFLAELSFFWFSFGFFLVSFLRVPPGGGGWSRNPPPLLPDDPHGSRPTTRQRNEDGLSERATPLTPQTRLERTRFPDTPGSNRDGGRNKKTSTFF